MALLFRPVLYCAAFGVAAASFVHASSINSATVYTSIPDPSDAADPLNRGPHVASANFSIGSAGIDFQSPPSADSVNAYLNYPTFSNPKNGFSPTNTVSGGIELYIQGTLSLNKGANSFVVGHDDGAVLNVAGFGDVVDAPGPTSFSESPFTVTASTAGNYAFTLEYAECCGLPADLLFNVNNNTVGSTVTPEPTSFALLGTGLVGMYGAARRTIRRRV